MFIVSFALQNLKLHVVKTIVVYDLSASCRP